MRIAAFLHPISLEDIIPSLFCREFHPLTQCFPLSSTGLPRFTASLWENLFSCTVIKSVTAYNKFPFLSISLIERYAKFLTGKIYPVADSQSSGIYQCIPSGDTGLFEEQFELKRSLSLSGFVLSGEFFQAGGQCRDQSRQHAPRVGSRPWAHKRSHSPIGRSHSTDDFKRWNLLALLIAAKLKGIPSAPIRERGSLHIKRPDRESVWAKHAKCVQD